MPRIRFQLRTLLCMFFGIAVVLSALLAETSVTLNVSCPEEVCSFAFPIVDGDPAEWAAQHPNCNFTVVSAMPNNATITVTGPRYARPHKAARKVGALLISECDFKIQTIDLKIGVLEKMIANSGTPRTSLNSAQVKRLDKHLKRIRAERIHAPRPEMKISSR